MPQITKAIGSRAFELIDLRIGEILADELASQAALIPDPNIAAPVYVERFVAVSATETPCVLVYLVRGDYGLKTPFSQDGEYTFNIDCYESSSTVGVERGDKTAMVKLQRLLGVCHGILSHQKYTTLGFARPFIGHRSVENMGVQQPSETKDSKSVVMGRLVLKVRANDTNLDEDYPIIDGFETQVGLDETAFGYLWGDPQIPPPPIDGPGSVNVNDSGGSLIANIVGDTPPIEYNVPDASITLDGAALIDAKANAVTDVQLVNTSDVTVVPVSIISGVIKISNTPTNIIFARLKYNGEMTSRALFDEAYNAAAGVFDFGESIGILQRLDYSAPAPFYTLVYLNQFGTYDRFSDDLGGQTYTAKLTLDHLTGVMYKGASFSSGNYTTACAATEVLTFASYSDWRVSPESEIISISDSSKGRPTNNFPYFSYNADIIASTTSNAGNALLFKAGSVISVVSLTTVRGYMISRTMPNV